MKVIFFGLGSIGTRHLHNLQDACRERGQELEVHAFRSNKKAVREEAGVTNIFTVEEMHADYDAAFITNPTSLHRETLELLKGRSRYYFVEKPLFERAYSLDDFLLEKECYYIAAPLRYKAVMAEALRVVQREQVLHARVHCSSYLPNWRKDDYRESYSARPELGGGIELDCIHELDYTTYLFGLPQTACSMMGKVSALEIASNDTATYLLGYGDKFVEVHVDYFGKAPQRVLELITEEDTYFFDFYQNTVRSILKGTTEEFPEETNEMYRRELAYFLDEVTAGRSNHNDLEHATRVLELAKGEHV